MAKTKRLLNEIVTAGRLMEYLKGLPQNAAIVLSCDEEGNNYSTLTDMGIGGLVTMDETMSQILDDGEISRAAENGQDMREALILYPSM